MRHFVWTVTLTLLTTACGDPQIFDRVAAPESAGAANAPYPSLADTPPVPLVGIHTDATPDPANGDAVLIELSAEASDASTRKARVEGPVE